MTNNIIKTINNYYKKKNNLNFKIGDNLIVSSILSKKLKRKQLFSGICISIKKNTMFTIRNIISKTYIDKTYNLNSSLLITTNIIKKNNIYKHSKLYNIFPKKPISQNNN